MGWEQCYRIGWRMGQRDQSLLPVVPSIQQSADTSRQGGFGHCPWSEKVSPVYLFFCKFFINSDHKPLCHIFDEWKSIPSMASARLQRWALTLSAYDYTNEYKPGAQNGNADLFSRLLPEAPNRGSHARRDCVTFWDFGMLSHHSNTYQGLHCPGHSAGHPVPDCHPYYRFCADAVFRSTKGNDSLKI